MPKQLILACHITGVYDVNRNAILPDDDFSIVKDWAQSIVNLGLNAIVFHNNFSEQTCKTFQNEHLSFIRVTHNPQFNPNVYRYMVYLDFLKKNANQIESFFITDIADVVLLKNPFVQELYLQNMHSIFCGDEPKVLANEWMAAHSTHLRSKIEDFAQYEAQFKAATLLNCGIVGGNFSVMQQFLEKLCFVHQNYNVNNPSAFTGDMGAFNYVIRKYFNDVVLHGSPINTEFKTYATDNDLCWLRHK